MSAASVPLVPALAPGVTATRTRGALYAAAVVGLGVWAIAAAAQWVVPLWPVPITGQTLPVLLLGFAVGWRLAVATTGAYLLAGLVGLPVFADGATGAGFLALPSGGYIVGFVLAGALVGLLGSRGWHRSAGLVVAGMVVGNLAIYAVGVPWLMAATGLGLAGALSAGVVPFLLGDAIKIALAAALLPALSSVARRARGA